MTDADKQKLINKLGADSNPSFGPRYSGVTRKWFVGKIIDFLLNQKVAVSDIEQRTTDIITSSAAQVKTRLKTGFKSGSLVDKYDLYDDMKSRTQIIFGMIAMNPEFADPANPQFADPANSSYFDFILERRYRAIQRMHFDVNPNDTRNVFAYPGDTEKMKVNKDGTPMWKPFLDESLPFLLNSLGEADPVKADDVLFKSNKGSDRNLFACDPVVTTLHMDALRAAKNPDKLLKALAGLGEHYLKIDNPLGHCANSTAGQRLVAVTSAKVSKGDHVEIQVGRAGLILQSIEQLKPSMLLEDKPIPMNRPKLKFMIVLGDLQDTFTIESVNPVTRKIVVDKLTNDYAAEAKIYVARLIFPFYSSLPHHFITDARPDHGLFEQLTLKSIDLQVGDHIYVINHPLYKIYFPTGAWGGEHSFITEIGNRDTTGNAFKNDLRLEGHGLLNDSLLRMSEEMLSRINRILSILQAVTPIHLTNLQTNGRKNGTVSTSAGKFAVTFTPRKEQFDSDTNPVDVNVFVYAGKYTYTFMFRGKKQSFSVPGFVIKERTDNPDAEFFVFNPYGTDSAVDPRSHVPARRVRFIGSGSSEQFILSKWAAPWFNTQTAKFESLPLFGADNKTPVTLTFDDLVLSKPFFATNDQGDVYVTRPRVDFRPAYQAFLKSIGAIADSP